MSYRCCKCKIVCSQIGNVGVYNTDEPCIHCGHKEYFWFDYYDQKQLIRRKNVKVDDELKKINARIPTNKNDGIKGK